jgi:hypothetical protein
MKRTIRLGLSLVRLCISVAVLMAETIAYVILWSLEILLKLSHARKAMRSFGSGKLHCPIGHVVQTEGQIYECGACGFVYGTGNSSIWQCENPECPAPVTSHISCSECGRSVRNPYRWGKP